MQALFAGVPSMVALNSPLGLPLRGGTSVSHALCGTGTGIQNDFLGLSSNPANLGATKRTVFSSAISSQFLFLSDGEERSQHLDMSLSSITLSIPFSKIGTLGVSVEPAGSSTIRYRSTGVLELPGSPLFAGGDTMNIGILRSGGSLAWQVGWGYDLLKTVRIGASVKRFNLEERLAIIREVSGLTMYNRSVDSTALSYSTYAFRGGLLAPAGKFTLGISGEYFFLNEAKRTRTLSGTGETSVGTSRNDFKPPPSLTIGSSCQLNPQWLVALDAGMTLWSRFYDESAPDKEYDNALQISGGFQYIPAPNLLTPKLWEITQYRSGVRYMQLPGGDGREIGVSLSAGVPMQTNGGLIDVILEYINRSDSRYPSHSENSIGIKLGINGGRKWYQNTEESY